MAPRTAPQRGRLPLRGWLTLCVAGALAAGACNGSIEHDVPGRAPGAGLRQVGPGTITLGFPERYGRLQRPAVVFDHTAHTSALKGAGCERCHERDDKGQLLPLYERRPDHGLDREGLTNLYHDKCMACHKEQRKGDAPEAPLACGGCHVQGPGVSSSRVPIHFDYSLHGRHTRQHKECGTCHHVKDKATGQLTYVAGEEHSCATCHGEREVDGVPALRRAAHLSCVGCHEGRKAANKPTGPVLCVGCHDRARQARIARMKHPPRIKTKGQPDMTWIYAPGSRSGAVAFDHKAHEGMAPFCSTCHHNSLKPCRECHILTGSDKGGKITLEQAYHHPTSKHSCVGCHTGVTAKKDCAGCHGMLQSQLAGSSCKVCHNGPSTRAALAGAPFPTRPRLAALPASSDAFPDEVVIDTLAHKFEPSVLPHRKIVAALDRAVRKSPLARAFHGDTATLCAGCHHHSPVGARPPACKSCHGVEGHPTRDKPRLLDAYHRQCVGCHQLMGLKEQGCTDCHARASSKPRSGGEQ